MKIFKFLLLIFILQINVSAFGINKGNNFDVKVAIVDVQLILESSTAISGIRKSIDAISQDIQKYLTNKELEFKKIEEDLIKKRATLTEKAFEEEVSLFNKKVNDAQKEMQGKKTKLEQAHAKAVSKVHEVTIEIINDLAKKYNFNLALPSSQILFATGELNITSEIITLLNGKLKSVKVNY